ncbi:hypothetical protein HBI23_182960 [Parastagonospora nodorum]|nr:hypothetical protein HBI12_172080 [Parastagonospora nodorum]KAH5434693.1 hypothetical protein HBI47_078850 [Parastagonospora nodorum]KAH5647096.1 hypothetical protein HBI23_182960 [Parastagonospora nodorum]
MGGPSAKRRAQAEPASKAPAPIMEMEPIIPQLDGTQNTSTDTQIKPLSFTCDSEPTAPVATIDPEQLTTDSLKKLQSAGERRLLDVVDKLRRVGLNGTIELPQLVVCGDQSSGKSSVLEAITEIPFPRKAGLCTRFATEIVLRRQPTSSVTIKINASKLRSTAEQQKLAAFTKTIADLSELPQVIEDATVVMGLRKIGESAAFSRDVLSIEICGPDRPQLTLVDLPGLIHSATKASTDADKDLIFGLVEEYMENPRTIVLAVVSAKNDAANQIILNLIKKMDPTGSRTLGIITKPDYIQGAGDQQFWFDLALNKEVFLKRGWHMVKNRTEEEMHLSFQQRNEAERTFFNKDRFKDLPRPSVGIETLRVRLSNLLLAHLTQELPSLKKEMEEKLKTTLGELHDLGDRRETPQEQRMLLTKISIQIHQILSAAVHGQYVDNFFGSVDFKSPVTNGKSFRRFRAKVQELNQYFAEYIRLHGHKYEFVEKKRTAPMQAKAAPESTWRGLKGGFGMSDAESEEESEEEVAELDAGPCSPEEMTHVEAVNWVRSMIRNCRGHELPGSVNPEVTSHLFWEQSAPWKDIAETHIEQVRSACKHFVQEVLEYAAPSEFRKPLEDSVVSVVLDETLRNAQDELKKLLQDKARPPSTYNHYYSDTIQKLRHDKYKAMLSKAKAAATVKVFGGANNANMNIEVFQQEIEKAIERDMETYAAKEALDCQNAIYKDKMKYFVTAVTDQVIERCMIVPLPSKILDPLAVAAMTDEEVAFIAAEPPETSAQRAFLEQRKQMLEKGKEIFREAMGGMKGRRGKTGL